MRKLRTLELTRGIDMATGKPLTPEQREERTQELRQAVTMLTTKDEADAWHSAPLSEQREFYGLGPIDVPGLKDADVQQKFG